MLGVGQRSAMWMENDNKEERPTVVVAPFAQPVWAISQPRTRVDHVSRITAAVTVHLQNVASSDRRNLESEKMDLLGSLFLQRQGLDDPSLQRSEVEENNCNRAKLEAFEKIQSILENCDLGSYVDIIQHALECIEWEPDGRAYLERTLKIAKLYSRIS